MNRIRPHPGVPEIYFLWRWLLFYHPFVSRSNKCIMSQTAYSRLTLVLDAGTGSYSDTPYSDSSYSDNSYSAAKVFMQVMFVTVTVPLGVTLYASCVGHFSMFTSAQ